MLKIVARGRDEHVLLVQERELEDAPLRQRVRRVDAAKVRQPLDAGEIVLITALGYSASGEAVSQDFIGTSYSSVVDSLATQVVGKRAVVYSDVDIRPMIKRLELREACVVTRMQSRLRQSSGKR